MTTPQPAALPEKLIFSERLAISEAAQVPMDAECCRVIQATLDYISSNYALAALQPQPAAAVSDEEIVAALEAAGVKFQRFMGGITGTKDCWSTAGSQDVRKLLAGVRAILALRPQAVPMTWELLTDERIKSEDFNGMYWLALKNGTVTTGYYQWRQGHNPYGFNTEEQGRISASDVSHIAPLAEPAHPGITAQGAQGEQA